MGRPRLGTTRRCRRRIELRSDIPQGVLLNTGPADPWPFAVSRSSERVNLCLTHESGCRVAVGRSVSYALAVRPFSPGYRVLCGLVCVTSVWQALDRHGLWRDFSWLSAVVSGLVAVGPIIRWLWGSDC
jgi:hypothetical protein